MSTPILITVNGTGVPDPFGPGFAADLGRAFTSEWDGVWEQLTGSGREYQWEPVGYSAEVFPMQPSVDMAKEEIAKKIKATEPGTKIAMSGYSQGAVATGQFWKEQMLDKDGGYQDRKDDVIGIVNFGDPLRCPGVANGNKVADQDMPETLDGHTTGGIAGPKCLKPDETPDILLSCALDGDLYACAPVGEKPWDDEPLVGEIETYIYDFVLSGDAGQGFMDIIEHVGDTFEQPLASISAHARAIFNGLKFASQGESAPHWQYQDFIAPVAEWLAKQARENA